MKKILHKIKHLIGRKQIVYPVHANEILQSNVNSTSGGTLEGKNVLIISNCLEDLGTYKEILDTEKCHISMAILDEKNAKGLNIKSYYSLRPSDIKEDTCLLDTLSGELVGPFDIIINSLSVGADELLFHIDSTENRFDGVKLFYQLSQIESDYFIVHNKAGHLLNICLYKNTVQANVVKASMKNLICGLGVSLGRHGIIVNGITAERSIPREDVIKTGAYLISRYGEVLLGEVMELKPFAGGIQ